MEFGDIIYLIIFVVISLLSSLSNKKEKKNKQKPSSGNQTQRNPAMKKEKSPIELLEEMFNDAKEPEPVYVPPKPAEREIEKRQTIISRESLKRQGTIARPKPEVIDLPKKKKYIRDDKYSTNAKSLRSKLKNPNSVRDLIVASELLGKPKAFQD